MNRRRVVIVGGGVSGLATAYELARSGADLEVVVLETQGRLGGNVVTYRRDGCTVDAGPDAILTTRPEGIDLCGQLGLGERLVAPSPKAARILVAHGKALHPMPEGLVFGVPRRIGQLASTPLVSWTGKLRATWDLFLPPNPPGDVSVGALVERRLGKEIKDRLVEPIVGGIYAGDIDKLDVAVALPPLAGAKRSLIGALATAPRPKGGSPFRVPSGGMDELVDALVAHVGKERVRTDVEVTGIARTASGWSVSVAGADPIAADELVVATPPHVASRLLSPVDAALGATLAEIRSVTTATVVLAFDAAKANLPDAGGLLIPRVENRALIAATIVSTKWPGRGPDGVVLLRAFVGGARQPELVDGATDEALVSLTMSELRYFFELPDPAWSTLFRWNRATALPEVGGRARIATIREMVAAQPGLHVVNAAYEGPGIPGCVAQARRAAKKIGATS